MLCSLSQVPRGSQSFCGSHLASVQMFRCGDLSLSAGAVHGNFLVRGGGSGYSSGDVKLWIRCDPLLGLEHKGDNHGRGVGRAEKRWCINWFLLSQLVYLSGHLNTYQRSTDKQFQYWA